MIRRPDGTPKGGEGRSGWLWGQTCNFPLCDQSPRTQVLDMYVCDSHNEEIITWAAQNLVDKFGGNL